MFKYWMGMARKERILPSQRVQFFLEIALLSELGSLVYLLLLPTSARNSLAFGFSASRLAMIAAFLVTMLITGGIFFQVERSARFHRWVEGLLDRELMEHLALFSAFVALLLLIATFTGLITNPFVAERLRPAFFLLLFLCVDVLTYQVLFLQRRLLVRELDIARRAGQALDWWTRQVVLWIDRHCSWPVLIVGLLVVTFPFLFGWSLRFSFPLGYAGLYTLIAEKIGVNGFSLPVSIPFYGPGGMPFAYPPAGFYLMAFALKILHIAPFDYLRLAPSLFVWLAMIPLALIALELSGSRLAAMIAVILVASSHKIFTFQATAAGMVRGLAFLLALTGVYLFLIAYRRSSWKLAVLSGLTIGLTALTHLGYAEFAAMLAMAFFVTHLGSRKAWVLLAIMSAATLLAVSGWVALMVSRYGWSVFQFAFQSHGNDYFLGFFQYPDRLIPWFSEALQPILRNPLMWGALVFGLLIAVLERKLLLPVWFGLVLVFMSENTRYLITLGALLAGLAVARLSSLPWPAADPAAGRARKQMMFGLAVALIFGYTGWQELFGGVPPKPVIGTSTLQLAEYVQNHTPAEWTYLVVADSGTAEWFPYLLQRVPVIGSWGGEWTGTYQQHLGYLLEMEACNSKGSFPCVQDLMKTFPVPPKMMITSAAGQSFSEGVLASQDWQLMYQNDGYQLWESRP